MVPTSRTRFTPVTPPSRLALRKSIPGIAGPSPRSFAYCPVRQSTQGIRAGFCDRENSTGAKRAFILSLSQNPAHNDSEALSLSQNPAHLTAVRRQTGGQAPSPPAPVRYNLAIGKAALKPRRSQWTRTFAPTTWSASPPPSWHRRSSTSRLPPFASRWATRRCCWRCPAAWIPRWWRRCSSRPSGRTSCACT